MAPHVNAMIATVDMIFPPIANSDVTVASKNPRLVSLLRTSDFYMIGGRAASFFFDVEIEVEHGRVAFAIQIKGGAVGRGFIKIADVPPIRALEDAQLAIAHSPSSITFYRVVDQDTREPLARFSPEDLLWRRGREESFVGGLNNYLELSTFDLLYVGKATGTDSFDRLLKNGHHARQRILSDEPQRFPGSRVSDEIYLFLFRLEPLLIRTWREEDEIDDDDLALSYSNNRLVSDAEKAFISLLKPEYNKEKYKNYPINDGGIYHDGYTGYTYSLSDGLKFRTAYGSMKGAREASFTLSNNADFISVKRDSVKLHIAGSDFEFDIASDPAP